MIESLTPLPRLTSERHKFKKTNRMIARAKHIKPADETLPCGGLNCDLNRATNHECSPPHEQGCDNHPFQTNPRPSLELTTDLPDIGSGLCFRSTPQRTQILAGEVITAYAGELIDEEELHRRHHLRGEDAPTYELALERDRYVDATHVGNELRYANNSCLPSAEYQQWVVKGKTTSLLIALKTLNDGDEITAGYYKAAPPKQIRECLCGTTNCSGYQGYPLNSRRKLPKHFKPTNPQQHPEAQQPEQHDDHNTTTPTTNTPTTLATQTQDEQTLTHTQQHTTTENITEPRPHPNETDADTQRNRNIIQATKRKPETDADTQQNENSAEQKPENDAATKRHPNTQTEPMTLPLADTQRLRNAPDIPETTIQTEKEPKHQQTNNRNHTKRKKNEPTMTQTTIETYTNTTKTQQQPTKDRATTHTTPTGNTKRTRETETDTPQPQNRQHPKGKERRTKHTNNAHNNSPPQQRRSAGKGSAGQGRAAPTSDAAPNKVTRPTPPEETQSLNPPPEQSHTENITATREPLSVLAARTTSPQIQTRLTQLHESLNPTHRTIHQRWSHADHLLDDSNIHEYLTHLAEKYDAHYNRRKSTKENTCWILDTHTLRNDILPNPTHRKLRKLYRKLDPNTVSEIIIPVHHNGRIGHWTLIHLDIHNKIASNYDSLDQPLEHDTIITETLRWWIKIAEETKPTITDEHGLPQSADTPNNWARRPDTTPKQTDDTSCGVHLLATADYLLDNKQNPQLPATLTTAARLVILRSLELGHDPDLTDPILYPPSPEPTQDQRETITISDDEDPQPRQQKQKQKTKPERTHPRTDETKPTKNQKTVTNPTPATPSDTTGVQISAAETKRESVWKQTMGTWTGIARALCQPNPPQLDTDLTVLMLKNADPRIQKTFEQHTTWNPQKYCYYPRPRFITSPQLLLRAITHLDPSYRKPDNTKKIPFSQLTSWSTLSTLALTTGAKTLNTTAALKLAKESHPIITAILVKHTSYHATENNYGTYPNFTTSARLLYEEIHQLTATDNEASNLTLAPARELNL